MREFDFDVTVEPDRRLTLQFPEDVPPGKHRIHVELDSPLPADLSQLPKGTLPEAFVVEEHGLLFLSAPPIPGAELDVVKLIAEIRQENEERALGMPIE